MLSLLLEKKLLTALTFRFHQTKLEWPHFGPSEPFEVTFAALYSKT